MNKIITSGDWVLRADIHKVAALPDSLHLAFNTQLLNTRFPQQRRTVYSVTLTRDEITKLRDIIDIHLLEVA